MARCVDFLVVLLLVLSPVSQARDHSHKKKGRELVAEYQAQFGMDMYSLMAERDGKSNIFFSPISIGTALAMAYAGSRGDTAQQMAAVLHFKGHRPTIMRGHRGLLRWSKRKYKKGVTVKMTNRVYAARDMRMRSKFSAFMERIFKAEVTRLNFGRARLAAKKINENVKRDTAGNIDQLVKPSMLSALTRMVLVNAIYFKGDWLMKFDREQTAPADFHTPSGPKQVSMMRVKKHFPVGHLWDMDARILELPYKGENINMMVLLPNKRDGLQALEAHLKNNTLSDLSWRTSADDPVEVRLPRFKMEEDINLKIVLSAMGMTDLFDPTKCDLTGISGRRGLHVTSAVHKAKIEVNEEGTEASAATALVLGFRMLRPKPKPFIADRPFVFAIRDVKAGSILFMGRVMDPTA